MRLKSSSKLSTRNSRHFSILVVLMAFKKTLAERLFNISKNSAQTLRNCRISSSAVHLRQASKPRETSIAPEPGDNAIFRRFLHKNPAATLLQRPETWSLPIGENLIETLKGMAVRPDRIRLDCLALREPQTERSPAVGSGLTAEETRKLLRVAQLEAVKSKLREVQKTWIPYSDYIRICREGCSDPDLGLGFAKSLDENGSVIILGNAVCLRPEQVAKAIQELIPIPGASENSDDPRIKELEHMEQQKFEIDRKAESLVQKELWLGLGYLVVQTAGFMRLTFWELSWDVMEPICFYVTSMYFMAGYAFFLRTSKEPSFEGFFQSRFRAKQQRLMKLQSFDEGRYDELRKACYPYLSSASSELAKSTAFDGSRRMNFGSLQS